MLIGVQVTKLVATKKSHDKTDLRTVELAKVNSTSRVSVTATKEVILSGGVIGTPKLLQLSGIGSSSVLKKVGITALVDAPDVGTQLKDQPFLPVYYHVKPNQAFDSYLRSPTVQMQDLAEWKANHTGFLSGSTSETVSYIRIPQEAPIFKRVRDPSAGLSSGHVEVLYQVRQTLSLEITAG